MSATLISPGGKAYALTHAKISFLSRNLSSKPEFSRFSVIKFYVLVRLTLILLVADTSEQRVTDPCHIHNHLFHSDCTTLSIDFFFLEIKLVLFLFCFIILNSASGLVGLEFDEVQDWLVLNLMRYCGNNLWY